MESIATQPAPKVRRAVPLLLLAGLFAAHVILITAHGYLRPDRFRILGIDPVCYYAYFHSIYFDRDLDFRNQYELLGKGYFDLADLTPRGLPKNQFSIGPAIALAPFLIAGDGVARMGPWPADGTSAPYHLAAFAGLSFYGFAALILMGLWCGRHFGPRAGAGAAAMAWGATTLVYYCFPQTLMPHAIGTASATLFLLAADGLDPSSRRSALAVGAALGLAALMRWQNAIFVLYPAVLSLGRLARALDRRAALKNEAVSWMGIALMAALVFLPQMLAWQSLYGRPFVIPEGEGFLLPRRAEIVKILFSAHNGLFSWTPLTAAALAGLALARRGLRLRALALAAVFALQLYLNSIVVDWHGSWGFGMRRFTELAPIFAFGCGAWITLAGGRSWRASVAAAGAIFILWNEVFIYQYDYHLISWDQPLTAHEFFGDKFHLALSYRRRQYIEQSLKALNRRDFDRASESARMAIECDPNHDDAFALAARIELRRGDRAAARMHYREALERRPGDPRLLGLLESIGP